MVLVVFCWLLCCSEKARGRQCRRGTSGSRGTRKRAADGAAQLRGSRGSRGSRDTRGSRGHARQELQVAFWRVLCAAARASWRSERARCRAAAEALQARQARRLWRAR